MESYAEAHRIKADDPKAPDEDFALYAEAVARFLANSAEDTI